MIQRVHVVLIGDYWLHTIKTMLHVFNLSVPVYKKSDKKTKLHFGAFQLLNLIPCNMDEAVFCFLEKLEDVFVAFRPSFLNSFRSISKSSLLFGLIGCLSL